MSNYPNMSYCMCENTALAMKQILQAMQIKGPMFLQDMNREEATAYRALFDLCEAFLSEVEELDDIIEHGEF